MNDLIITPNGSGWIAIILLLIRTITWSCPSLALLDVRLGGNRFISARGNAVPSRELLVIRRNQDFLRAVYGQLTGRGPQSVATLRSRSFRFTAAITRARPAIECALCNSTRGAAVPPLRRRSHESTYDICHHVRRRQPRNTCNRSR